MKILNLIRDAIGKVSDLSGILAGISIFLVSIFITWGVIARYFLFPSHWVEPVSVYMFIAAAFLAMPYAMKKMDHIRVDLIVSKLPGNLARITDTITLTLAVVFFFYLTWRGFELASSSYTRNTKDLSIIQVPLWIPQIFLAVGSILLTLSIIRQIIIIWTERDYEKEVE